MKRALVGLLLATQAIGQDVSSIVADGYRHITGEEPPAQKIVLLPSTRYVRAHRHRGGTGSSALLHDNTIYLRDAVFDGNTWTQEPLDLGTKVRRILHEKGHTYTQNKNAFIDEAAAIAFERASFSYVADRYRLTSKDKPSKRLGYLAWKAQQILERLLMEPKKSLHFLRQHSKEEIEEHTGLELDYNEQLLRSGWYTRVLR